MAGKKKRAPTKRAARDRVRRALGIPSAFGLHASPADLPDDTYDFLQERLRTLASLLSVDLLRHELIDGDLLDTTARLLLARVLLSGRNLERLVNSLTFKVVASGGRRQQFSPEVLVEARRLIDKKSPGTTREGALAPLVTRIQTVRAERATTVKALIYRLERPPRRPK